MEAVVYILYSASLKRFYIGATTSLSARLHLHNTKGYGRGKFTAKANDWELYLMIDCSCMENALKIEAHIKRMKSANYIKNLQKYPEMIDKLMEKYC
ncbi:GIY-YIG nuclease family protein [Candidatus Pollutiaquabacter sp.]|uniref:GIY-YIG nuclease family protein n=1 Tax=Candidatus Pollutiaquabacter sp. TaxID=3416354 RepID=UPI003CBDAD79|nr:GIY-YIG nuclease family protein [Bacteroidota bacterium]